MRWKIVHRNIVIYPNTVKTYDAALDVILVVVDGSFLKRSFVGEEEGWRYEVVGLNTYHKYGPLAISHVVWLPYYDPAPKGMEQ